MKKLPARLAVMLALTLVFSHGTFAQLYKWVDEHGKVHYGDSPPKNADLKKITGKVSSYTSVSVEGFEYDPANITEYKTSKTVVMYSTSWCGYCKKAASHFRSKNIPFREYDIEKNEKAAREYKKLNGRGVPVILIGKRRMNGFNAPTFDKIYYGS